MSMKLPELWVTNESVLPTHLKCRRHLQGGIDIFDTSKMSSILPKLSEVSLVLQAVSATPTLRSAGRIHNYPGSTANISERVITENQTRTLIISLSLNLSTIRVYVARAYI